MDLYNLDIPGGSEWKRIWLTLGFPFFLTFLFISFRFLPLPQLTPPVEFATGPRLFSLSLLPLSPFPTGWSKDLADHFSVSFHYGREIHV